MKFVPFEPQVIAREFLEENLNCYLAVGMGLGKSAAILNYINDLFTDFLDCRGVLIVSPLRVKNLTWPAEAKKYDQFRWLKVADLRTEHGQRQFIRGSAHLYLINFESLVIVPRLLAKKRSGRVPYDMVVWDEGTKMKAPDSKRLTIARKFLPRVKRNVVMSGTPQPNSEIDLWAQYLLVDGGERLGKSFSHFCSTWFSPSGFQGRQWRIKPEAAEKIHKRISDITLVLRTSEYLDLPDVVVEDIDVPLSPKVMAQYDEFEKELILELAEGGVLTAANSAVLATKLLQFTSGAVYDGERVSHAIHDAKIKALRALRKRVGGSMLVAYGYQHEMERVRKEFPEAEFLNDAKTDKQQVSMFDRWNAGKIPMLVAHPLSMSHGLNLQHGGNTLVWLTLTYNRDAYQQTPGRLQRRGQENVVQMFRLMCPGTADEAVAESLRCKGDRETVLFDALKRLQAIRAKGGVIEIDEEDLI